MTMPRVSILHAQSPEEIAAARSLMIEYRDSISTPLCFQNFDAEMAGLPGRYAPPSGRMFLAMFDDDPVGCIALREIPGDKGRTCEMKRLYVQPSYRGLGLGRQLCDVLIDAAKELRYAAMRLDTDSEMAAAQGLYASLGFAPIAKYNDDPIPDTLFFELMLKIGIALRGDERAKSAG